MRPFDISHGTRANRNNGCVKCVCKEEYREVRERKVRQSQDVKDPEEAVGVWFSGGKFKASLWHFHLNRDPHVYGESTDLGFSLSFHTLCLLAKRNC